MAGVKGSRDDKFHVKKVFSATGVLGNYTLNGEIQVRFAVEGVGGGNVVTVKGKMRGQAAYTALTGSPINGATATTFDTSIVDELEVECTTFAASGTPTLIGSGWHNKV